MRWSNNDQWMLTADHGGFVKYWQSNMNNVKMYQAHKDPVRDLRWALQSDIWTEFGTTEVAIRLSAFWYSTRHGLYEATYISSLAFCDSPIMLDISNVISVFYSWTEKTLLLNNLYICYITMCIYVCKLLLYYLMIVLQTAKCGYLSLNKITKNKHNKINIEW